MNTFRRLLSLGLAAVGLAYGGHAVQGAPRPNILFLFSDDHRADCLGAYGNKHVRTPHLDRLISEGFSFRRNYIFGSNNGAVCVPSRAMLMSGKTWFKVHAPTLRDARSWPEMLRGLGYATFATGKWHNGQDSWLRAFEQGKSIMFGGMSDHTQVPLRDLGANGKLSEVRTGKGFSSELFADAAIEFLRHQDGSKPFLCYAAFTAPHDPRQAPPEYLRHAYAKLPPVPRNFLPQLPFDNGMMRDLRDENLAAWPREKQVIRDQLAEYYALISHLDSQIGRVLACLRESGFATNTLVVFAGDNGLALGSHGLLGKQSLYEHSMKVPLVISGPGVPRGRTSSSLTYLHDFFPTLCELLEVAPDPGLDGASLKPIWEGKKKSIRSSIFLPFQDIQRGVLDERWKLIIYPNIGHMELFDLQKDPWEMRNLVGKRAYRSELVRMMGMMRDWQKMVGDRVELPMHPIAPAPVDLSGKPRTPDQWQPAWIVDKYF